jgi:hypothetical protein
MEHIAQSEAGGDPLDSRRLRTLLAELDRLSDGSLRHARAERRMVLSEEVEDILRARRQARARQCTS